jgi:hypothetical protein
MVIAGIRVSIRGSGIAGMDAWVWVAFGPDLLLWVLYAILFVVA